MEKFQKYKYVFSSTPSILDVVEEAARKREKQINLLLDELNNYTVVLKDLIIYKPNAKDKNLLLNVAYFKAHSITQYIKNIIPTRIKASYISLSTYKK